MKYENHIEANENGTTIIKGTEISVLSILRLLSENNSIDEIISTHTEITNEDILACLEYATELVIVYDYKKSNKKINEHVKKRYAMAERFRALKNQSFFFKDENGNEIDISKM